jgi:hypothetical protein
MIIPHTLTLFDASAILTMIILAYLSRRLGEALKVPPLYRVLYLTSVFIAIAAIGETISNDIGVHIPQSIPMLVRLVSAGAAFLVCLKYWNWAFFEYLRK